MGNLQSCVVASLTAASALHIFYTQIYCSYKLKSTVVNYNDRTPGFVFLFIKYMIRALSRSPGHLYADTNECVSYTVTDCRMQPLLLRRFCRAAGYGWDYPDSEGRDLPLCFPEILCLRLLLMVLSAGGFRLNPAGLIRVRQSVKTWQPVDELKKGPFTLRARVLGYRRVDAGAEVDISLAAASRAGCPVWESVLTLLSRNKRHTAPRPLAQEEIKVLNSLPVCPPPDTMKRVEIRVPGTAGLRHGWCFSGCSLYGPLTLAAGLLGCCIWTSPSLWMLSVCLAEVEKHRGVEVIKSPINITVRFQEPLLVPNKVIIKFWRTLTEDGPSPERQESLTFQVEQNTDNITLMEGLISRT